MFHFYTNFFSFSFLINNGFFTDKCELFSIYPNKFFPFFFFFEVRNDSEITPFIFLSYGIHFFINIEIRNRKPFSVDVILSFFHLSAIYKYLFVWTSKNEIENIFVRKCHELQNQVDDVEELIRENPIIRR